MGLREEIKDYLQPDGLIVPRQSREGEELPDSTGNGLLYLSLYHILLVRRGESRVLDYQDFERIVKSCEREAGLMHRSPTKIFEQNSFDDYVGVCAASYHLKSRWAHRIVNYGNGAKRWPFKWIYNNLEPGKMTKQSWFGRRPDVIAHMQFSTSIITPHIFRVIWQAVAIAVSDVGSDSSVIQRFLMIEVAKERSLLIRMASAIWHWRLNRAWPYGFKQVLARHFDGLHPIVRYWK